MRVLYKNDAYSALNPNIIMYCISENGHIGTEIERETEFVCYSTPAIHIGSVLVHKLTVFTVKALIIVFYVSCSLVQNMH